MHDADAGVPRLDHVVEPQTPSGQGHLRGEVRVGLDGDEAKSERAGAWRLALAPGADLEGSVDARPLDAVPGPVAPVLNVDIASPDRVGLCGRLGAMFRAPRHGASINALGELSYRALL